MFDSLYGYWISWSFNFSLIWFNFEDCYFNKKEQNWKLRHFTNINYFPSISYYFHMAKFFDYLDSHCPTLEKIGTDEKVICYHNISNLLWKKDVLCVWKQKWISKTLQILGLTASNLQTFFLIHFFFLTLEQFFLTVR